MMAQKPRRSLKCETTGWEYRRTSVLGCSSGSSAPTRILRVISTERGWVSASLERQPRRWAGARGPNSWTAAQRSASPFRLAAKRTKVVSLQQRRPGRLSYRTVKPQRVRHAEGIVPPFLVVVHESFRFHSRFELLSIHSRQSTCVRRVSHRREGIERRSHLELLA